MSKIFDGQIKCLLVDDLNENLIALEALLKDLGATLVKARSGVEALELSLQHQFAVALIDVQMPDMDGFELAELLRGSEKTRHIPLIFLTAGHRDYERVFRGYEAGAVDFLYKPIDSHILKSKVRIFLELYEQRFQLRKQEELFRSTFESAALGIAHVSPEGKWLRVNPFYRYLLGYSEDEMINSSYDELSHPDDLVEDMSFRERLKSGELNSYSMEKRFINKSGEAIWTRLQVALTRTQNGEPDYFICSIQDISSEKEYKIQLLQAKDKADSAARAKSEFLANMSHEIRTPLTAILGFADLLLDVNNKPSEFKQFLTRIRTNGDALLHLIEDVLDLSKFENGKMPIDPAPMNLKDLVDEVISTFEFIVKEKKIDLSIKWETEIPNFVKMDRLRVRQVLMNLISNAVKFTNRGYVQVTGRVCDRSDDTGELELIVEDTGGGISQEKQEAIFKPFTQADNSITRRFGGTGLGLTLSRRIASAMGGRLELVRSELDVGSSFRCILPFEVVSSSHNQNLQEGFGLIEDRHGQSKGKLGPAKILLAEDSIDNQTLIQVYLSSEEVQLDTVTNGKMVLDAVKSDDYDLILMDMQMPVMDGLQATAQLREMGCKIPIIAVTAHSFRDHIEQAYAAGCSGYVTKPFDRKDLLSEIEKQLEQGSNQQYSQSQNLH